MASSTPKHTKVVCTIGPASESKAVLTRMVRAGMNVARLNFSHGEYAWHARAIRTIRSVARATGEPIAILQDLQGPKVRVGVLPKEGIPLVAGKPITLTTATAAYRGGKIPLTYRSLHRDVAIGHRILFDDGLLEVRVTRVRGRDIACVVVTGGMLKTHKGMNLPDTAVDIPALTAKDRKDVVFGVAAGVDFIALSFVKHARDVALLRALITRLGGRQHIIAKIEKHEAIANFTEILAAVDGIMVARGDLGVEIPAAEVPIRQKEIIERCRAVGKPVIVATQMLDSMIRNPRPTRAEVSDVANAIIDHTDAVMLSGESATGEYPVQAVAMLAGIARETEASRYDDVQPLMPPPEHWELGDVVAEVSALLAAHADIRAILVATLTGKTARRIARFHPAVPIYAATPDPLTMRTLNVSYGVQPFVVPHTKNRDALVRAAVRILQAQRRIRKGNALIIVAGEPWGQPGTANAVEVRTI
ncbi:pyruvate kinase [Candidatus Uhrbacteria bacterium]|nr:pyruvate kinase [Candidatus Uhrbacteria bacterium]